MQNPNFDYTVDGLLHQSGEIPIVRNSVNDSKEGLLDVMREIELLKSDLGEPPSKVKKKPAKDLPGTSQPFCLLCLRECFPDMAVRFGTKGLHADNSLNAFECQRMLKNVTGFRMKLKNRTVCRTCWKMVEMLADFKDCCLKAESKAQQLTEGFRYDEEADSWLCSGTLAMIDQTHRWIKMHAERIEPELMVSVEIDEMREEGENERVKQETVENVPFMEEENEGSGNAKQALADKASHDEEEEEDLSIKLQPVVDLVEKSTTEQESETLIEDIGQVMIECPKCGKMCYSKAAFTNHSLNCDGTCPRGVGTRGAKVPYFGSVRVGCAGSWSSESAATAPKESKYQYDCSVCSAKFFELRKLKYHMNKHKGTKPYVCRVGCGNAYYSNDIRRHHEAICNSEKRICAICGLELKNITTLDVHMKSVHVEANQECSICGRMFKSRKLLGKHMLVHSNVRNFPCHVCGKAFKSSYAAKVHMRIHTQEKPFQCVLCGMAFAYKCLLKGHTEQNHGSGII